MNYIINPWWFYFINIIDSFNIFLLIITVLSGFIIIVFSILYIYGLGEGIDYGENDPNYKRSLKIKKPLRILIIVFIILILLVIFIPSKQVLVQMQVAKFATYENAELTMEAIKNATDYIIEAFKEIKW